MMADSKICKECGKPLTLVESLGSGVCSSIQCKTSAFVKVNRKANTPLENKVASHEEYVQKEYEQFLTSSELDKSTTPLIVLPAVDSKTTTFPIERKRAFLNFLARMIRLSTDAHYERNKDKREDVFNTTNKRLDAKVSESEIVGKLCSICKGYCCQNGEVFAYITPTMIRERSAQTSVKSLRRLFLLYKSFLPKESVNASCVYHTDKGCALPISLRSNTCNTFLCKASADAIKLYREKPYKQAYVVSRHPEYVVRKSGVTF